MTAFEARLRTSRGGRFFRDPFQVVQATRPEEVVKCLAEVQDSVRAGAYAAGFVTYEAAAAFGLATHPTDERSLPLVSFGLFAPDSVTSDVRLPAAGSYNAGRWEPSITHAEYGEAIRRVKARIEAGDTYQINLTFRLKATFEGDPLALLRDLDAAQDGPWGAHVDTGRHVICSASPELFFAIDGDRLECRPMKGTAPRGLWPEEDRRRAERLRGSEKNRAENVMVVDMVRNDLGRIARTGSVETEPLFRIERYPLQWQMTSTVRARAPGVDLPRLFEALFPSGSITGAPKFSSMEIIRELEPAPRGIYTGAIGYLSPHGRGHFHVAIRTIAIDRNRQEAEFGVGSGVVWDSVERDEYDECLLKASILLKRPPSSYAVGTRPDFRLLETIAWTPEGGFALLPRHFERLAGSAASFGFECDVAEIGTLLKTATEDLPAPARVRVLLSRDGGIVCEAVDLSPPLGRPVLCAIAADPVDPADVFLYHKTTRRGVYERARASRPEADAVILCNTAGDVTEATEANVVVLLDGRRVTPPIDSGLLAGTLRAELLEKGVIVEARVSVAELHAAKRIWLINSVRGWLDAELIPDPPSASARPTPAAESGN